MSWATQPGRFCRRCITAALLATGALAMPLIATPPALAASTPIITDYAGTGAIGAPVPGPATSSPLGEPDGVAVDAAGNMYIADPDNSVIEKVTPDGILSIVAGNGTYGPPIPGPATSSPLSDPGGVAVDSSGNLYIADFRNDVVEKVTPGGVLSIFAGTGTAGPPTPGPATSSNLWRPTGAAVDATGNVYIADWGNHRVEKVDSGGTLSTFAGTGAIGPPTPGPATSSTLSWPLGVAADSSGNVYIADTNNQVIEKVTAGGTLSIIAGTGAVGPPSPGPATGSTLNYPAGVALDSGGDMYIADSNNSVIEKVTPGGALSIVAGNGTRGAPSYGGPATASPINFPGSVAVAAGGALYIDDLGNSTIDLVLAPPSDLGVPTISGTAGVGGTLSCSQGTWSGNPTNFMYQWTRDGAPIASASGQTYVVQSADQGHTLTCTVTASNSAGSASASSLGVLVPITNVSLCPQPSGSLAGTRLGPVWLGLSRSIARRMLPRFSLYSSHTDNFCLAGGWGIRAGYATGQLLRKLPGHPHASGIILLLTASPTYSLGGVTPGMTVTAAKARLKLGTVLHLGLNWWYVIPGAKANGVLKTRDGVVQEIGIANKRLTTTGLQQVRLLAHF